MPDGLSAVAHARDCYGLGLRQDECALSLGVVRLRFRSEEHRVGSGFNGSYEDKVVLVKPLSNGDIALGCFNFGETDGNVNLEFWDIGLPATGYGLEIYDCLSHTVMGTKWEGFAPMVPAHGCRVFRGKVVSKSGAYDE